MGVRVLQRAWAPGLPRISETVLAFRGFPIRAGWALSFKMTLRWRMATLLAAAACAEPARPFEGVAAGAALLASTAELRLDETVQASTTPGVQRAPAIVGLPSGNHLVVWEDSRRGDFDVWAAVVNDVTAQLAFAPYPLVLAPGNQRSPAVACGAQRCIVAWEDGPSGRISGTLLEGNGRPLISPTDPNRPILRQASGAQRLPSLAARDGTYLLVWEDVNGAETDVYGAFMNDIDAGAVGIVVDDRPGVPARAPRAAAASPHDQWLVVWEEPDAGIDGRRLGTSAAALDAAPFRIASSTIGDPADPAVAWIGEAWQVAWSQRVNANADIYGARVGADGGVTQALLIASGGADQITPAVAPNSIGAFVAWAQRNGLTYDVHGVDIGVTGAGGAVPIVTAAGDQTAPALETEGNSIWLAWRDDRARDNQSDIYVTVINGSANVAQTLVSVFPSEQTNVRIAGSMAGRYLAVWEDTRNPNNGGDIYGALLDGTAMAAMRLPVMTDDGPQVQPAVASNGSDFLVVFADGDSRNIRARLVSAGGTPGLLAPSVSATVLPAQVHSQPDVTWDSAQWFIVYRQETDTTSSIRASRIGMLGNGPVPIVVRDSPSSFPLEPAVAAIDDIVLVVWSEKNATSAGYDVLGRRYDKSGNPLESVPFEVAAAPQDQRRPAIGADEEQFLVVWHDSRAAGPGQQEIWGARVGKSGDRPDQATAGVRLSAARWVETKPTVAYDGRDFIVAWEDHRDAAGTAVWAERVRPSDLAHYPEETVADRGALAPTLAVAFNSPGVVGYHRLEPRPDGGRAVFARMLLGRGGASCLLPADCQSGVCIAGVCADVDAGAVLFDAGIVSRPDAGLIDAGVMPGDGGAGGGGGGGGGEADGGVTDAGTGPGEAPPLLFNTSACGCAASDGVALAAGALFLLLRGVRRRLRLAAVLLAAGCAESPPSPSATLRQAAFADNGSVMGFSPTRTSSARFGHAVHAFPDPVRGGSRGYVAVGAPHLNDRGAAYVYAPDNAAPLGNLVWSMSESDAGLGAGYGTSITSADLNGDGRDDLVVGAPGARTDQGIVYVYKATTTGFESTSTRLFNLLPGSRYGTFVAKTPDMNSDGKPDLLIGAPGISSAYLLVTTDAGLAGRWQFSAPGSIELGAAGASRDFNEDGYPDVVLGDPGFNLGQGRLVVFNGLADGGFALGTGASNSSTSRPRLGACVVPVDANGDLVSDLLAGAPGADGDVPGEGGVYLYLSSGAPQGLGPVQLYAHSGNEVDGGYGTSAAAVGDVDADGKPDVIVGAPRLAGRGAVFLHTSLTGSPPERVDYLAPAGSQFGFSVSGGFDFNGDGALDIVVGAPERDGEGAVYLGFGTSSRSDAGMGGTGGGAGGGAGGGPAGGPGGAGGAGGGGNTRLEIVEDALSFAVIGQPWSYNGTGFVKVTGGTAPHTFASCAMSTTAFIVEASSGKVSWVPVGADGTTVTLCVSASSADAQTDSYVFTVTLRTGATTVAGMKFAPDPATVGREVTFDGSSSVSPLGVAQWRWDFGDQTPLGSGAEAKHTYARAGSYGVHLVVVDRDGTVASARASLRVLDALGRKPPLARILSSRSQGRAPLVVALGAETTRGDAELVSWAWEASDGQTSRTDAFTPTFARGGTYRVRLTVTDANGLSAYDSIQLEVFEDLLGPPPPCRASVDPAAVPVGGTVHFRGEWPDRAATMKAVLRHAGAETSDPQTGLTAKLPAPGPSRATLEVVGLTGLSCVDFVDGIALDPPRIASIDTQKMKCGTSLTLPLAISGADPMELKLEGPAGATLEGPVLKWTPPSDGQYAFTVRALNADGLDEATVKVGVDCEPLEFGSGACGCSSGSPLLLAWLALALTRVRRSRR